MVPNLGYEKSIEDFAMHALAESYGVPPGDVPIHGSQRHRRFGLEENLPGILFRRGLT